ncbi:MAG: hypothetical protein IKA03_07005 [Alphaproteobacteria bacterium]|nr:hypothetical protein [Alphaproteobacteria bacterium]
MSNEDLMLAAEEAKKIAMVAKSTGFGKPEVLASKESRDATPELMELMNEHGLGIGLHKGVNALDAKAISNGYTRNVDDVSKARDIAMAAEKEYNTTHMLKTRAVRDSVSSR